MNKRSAASHSQGELPLSPHGTLRQGLAGAGLLGPGRNLTCRSHPACPSPSLGGSQPTQPCGPHPPKGHHGLILLATSSPRLGLVRSLPEPTPASQCGCLSRYGYVFPFGFYSLLTFLKNMVQKCTQCKVPSPTPEPPPTFAPCHLLLCPSTTQASRPGELRQPHVYARASLLEEQPTYTLLLHDSCTLKLSHNHHIHVGALCSLNTELAPLRLYSD